MGAKYIIKNATVVSVDTKIGTVSPCDVLIEDGLISDVGPNLQHTSEHQIIDGTDTIVSPGFVDTHRHVWQTQLRTMTTDYVLTDYLLSLRHTYGSCYTAHDAYMGNYCGALESLDNGTTCLIDHSHIMNSPEHADLAVKGLRDSNIRAVFCYGLYPNPSWEGSSMDKAREEKTPDWRLQDAQRVRETLFPNNGPDELVRFGFSTSEPEITPYEKVAEEVRYAKSLGAAVITAHNHSIGKFHAKNDLVRNLEKSGLLGPDILLSHCAYLDDEELDLIKKRHMGISSTPDTELQMGMGHPIAFKAKDHGCCASLGVDICSNSPADMFQQMRVLLQAQRHLEYENNPKLAFSISRRCAEILEIATLGGAKAIGLEKTIGSITPGKRADLLITRCDSPRMVPVHDPVGALVLYANGSDIDMVFVDGKIVKSGGKLAGVNWPRVREELRASAASVIERSKKTPAQDLQAARDAMVAMIIT
ncbi:hypothetical protein G7046_g2649 [Stylonectria norvegica]|nr:hypothetical protein G7046_g2649 [Stylonectria norvegica]